MEPWTHMPTVTVSAENVRSPTAVMAGWHKWLVEPGGGARAKTGRREKPSREPRPERLLRPLRSQFRGP